MTNANDILMGSGGSAAKFPTLGSIVTGTVTREPEARQQTTYRTGIPETWPDGSPKMQVIVQLATSERDPQKPDDDGSRNLYIKGKELTKAIRDAVRAAGANGIHTGGTLTVQYIADGPVAAGLDDGPKLYAASYVPPAVSFNGVTAPASAPVSPAPQGYAPAPAYQQPVYQQPAAPVYQQPAAPMQPAMIPAPVQHMPAPVQQAPQSVTAVLGAPAGVDPNVWARLDTTQRDAVLAAMGTPVAAGF